MCELKCYDKWDHLPITLDLTCPLRLISTITAGQGNNNRIGNYCRIKSIKIKMHFDLLNQIDKDLMYILFNHIYIRVILLKRKSTPQWDGSTWVDSKPLTQYDILHFPSVVYEPRFYEANWNFDNRTLITILKDKTFTMGPLMIFYKSVPYTARESYTLEGYETGKFTQGTYYLELAAGTGTSIHNPYVPGVSGEVINNGWTQPDNIVPAHIDNKEFMTQYIENTHKYIEWDIKYLDEEIIWMDNKDHLGTTQYWLSFWSTSTTGPEKTQIPGSDPPEEWYSNPKVKCGFSARFLFTDK